MWDGRGNRGVFVSVTDGSVSICTGFDCLRTSTYRLCACYSSGRIGAVFYNCCSSVRIGFARIVLLLSAPRRRYDRFKGKLINSQTRRIRSCCSFFSRFSRLLRNRNRYHNRFQFLGLSRGARWERGEVRLFLDTIGLFLSFFSLVFCLFWGSLFLIPGSTNDGGTRALCIYTGVGEFHFPLDAHSFFLCSEEHAARICTRSFERERYWQRRRVSIQVFVFDRRF